MILHKIVPLGMVVLAMLFSRRLKVTQFRWPGIHIVRVPIEFRILDRVGFLRPTSELLLAFTSVAPATQHLSVYSRLIEGCCVSGLDRFV
jgi:hypothetical protein